MTSVIACVVGVVAVLGVADAFGVADTVADGVGGVAIGVCVHVDVAVCGTAVTDIVDAATADAVGEGIAEADGEGVTLAGRGVVFAAFAVGATVAAAGLATTGVVIRAVAAG